MDERREPPIAIRPMGIGEVIDAGIRLTRQHYRLLVTLVAWGVVPSFILGIVASVEGFQSAQTILATFSQAPGTIVIYALIEIIIGLVTAVASIAAILACARIVEGAGDLRPAPLFSAAFGRLGAYILLIIVFGIVAIPLVIIFPLGIFVGVRWAVSWTVLIIERLGPFGALGRSWDLTKGSWWHTLGVMVIASLLVAVLGFVVGGIFGAIGGIFAATGNALIGGVFTTLGTSLTNLFITPFSFGIFVVLYYELRARREGFDLELRGRQMPEAP